MRNLAYGLHRGRVDNLQILVGARYAPLIFKKVLIPSSRSFAATLRIGSLAGSSNKMRHVYDQ